MRAAIFQGIIRRNRLAVGLSAAILLCLALGACATLREPGETAARQELQWPPLPLPARIVWVNEIGSYRDVGISKGFWQRVTEAFAGAEEERIGKPYGVLMDDKRRLFIVDVGFAMVHVMDLQQKRYFAIGGGKVRVFRSPIAVAEDDRENLYITDSGAGAIYRYNLKKEKLEPFIVADLGRPTGIAFNPKNRLLYVTDTTNHQIAVFDLRGNERFRIGGRGEGVGQFNYPTDLFVDDQGLLYVTDALNARVTIFSADGAHMKTFGRPGDTSGDFAKPKGVAVDRYGNIYVCDALLDAVQIFNAEGALLLTFGSNGEKAGQFWMPSGIFIDKNDNIYVSDSYNRRVQVFKYLSLEAVGRGGAQPAGAVGKQSTPGGAP